jgi:predicted nucleotidyltransferase
MKPADVIIRTIRESYPDVQAIYMFGSYGTADEWPTSDLDIAVLLPPEKAKTLDPSGLLGIQSMLKSLLHKSVDLLNVRRVSTVFQKEIVMDGRRIYTGDEYAAGEFEMLALSSYQKLNEERAEILADFLLTGKAYAV